MGWHDGDNDGGQSGDLLSWLWRSALWKTGRRAAKGVFFFFKTGHRGSALFSLFSGQQSPYMHPSAELYIPVSDVHPSLAMQITLFSLLRGIKNLEKPKKQNDRTHVPVSKTSKNQKKQKNKMTGPMSQYPKPRKTKKNKKKLEKPKKKQNDRTHVPVSKTSKNPQKKQKGRTYVPVSGMGSVLLFFCFFGFSR